MSDTEAITLKWLQTCGPCDAGIGAPCTHPDEDYRPVIAMLLRQRDEARATVQRVRDATRGGVTAHAVALALAPPRPEEGTHG